MPPLHAASSPASLVGTSPDWQRKVMVDPDGRAVGCRGFALDPRFRAMPSKKATEKARQDLRRGKSASTAAGEFVKEEIDHGRQGKHGARATKQAIAIGPSEA